MRNRFVAAVLFSSIPSLLLAGDEPSRQRAIESNLATQVAIEGVKGKSLQERMKELGVPAVSYAVVENGKVVLAAAHGYADVGLGRRATPSTLFQAASISKPVTAMAVMDLVERGKLSLDVPVNSLLRSWKLPENELTSVTPVTLRHLLSHSGGTTVHGFPGYASNGERPTLTQLLEGKEPANTAPIIVDIAPNTKYNYSGGGTSVVQAAIVDQERLSFPTLMRRTVLAPLGMTSSSYAQPLPPSQRTAAATGYRIGGRELDGKWHVYPEMAAAGLWTTPAELSQVIIEMQNALAGRETKLLSIDAARHMLTKRFDAGGPEMYIGLGFFVMRRGEGLYFQHGGANEGFRATLFGSVDGSRGAVVMSNSDGGGALNHEILATIAREYSWPGLSDTPLQRGSLSDEDAARFEGRYIDESGEVIALRRGADGLEVLDLTEGWQPLHPISDGTVARVDRDIRYGAKAEGIEIISDASSTSKRAIAKRLASDASSTGYELVAAGSIDEAMTAFREEFKTKPIPEATLNQAGYTFLFAGRTREAIAMLQLNTEFYPASANTHDSLAEALAVAGEIDRAIASYEEVLRRVDSDPTAPERTKNALRSNAMSRLKALRKGK